MVWGSHILGNLRGLHVFLVSELAKEVAKTHGFLRAFSGQLMADELWFSR